MLYRCHQCNSFAFTSWCHECTRAAINEYVPLEPKYYPEFQYESKGFVKDLFIKRKETEKLKLKLFTVLRKYAEFENPYFVNYVHIADRSEEESGDATEYSKLNLFTSLLVDLGFTELDEFPDLTRKLVRSTAFRFLYSGFVDRIQRHIASNLYDTLKSWIEETGTSFRKDLPLMLYYCWTQKKFTGEVDFSDDLSPLVPDQELTRWSLACEAIYFDILVERLKTTLERFEPAKFVTIYAVDAMDGFEFEDFLAELFRTLGYDVQTTKRTADQGADLFTERFGQKIVIQAKNYTDSVGNSAVQQVLAAKTFYSCDKAMVVTNSYFTPSVKELAESTDVRLVDRKELQTYLDEYNRTILEAARDSVSEGEHTNNQIIELTEDV